MTDTEFHAAFHAHKDAVYRFLWRMTGSNTAAEDLAQDVFLVLLRAPERYDPDRGGLRQYLIGVARNLALRQFRRENRWNTLDEDQFVAESIDLDGVETAESVARAVQELPPLQREALILSVYEEMSLEEIARVAEVEIGTVKSRLFRARENLRRMLAPMKSARSTVHGTAK